MKAVELTHKERDAMARFACAIADIGAEDALDNEISKKLAKVVCKTEQQLRFALALCELAWKIKDLDVIATTDFAEKTLKIWINQNMDVFTPQDVLYVGFSSGILVMKDGLVNFASEEYLNHLAKNTLMEYIRRMSQ